MIFRDVLPGQPFTFWEKERHLHALKLMNGAACLLSTGEVFNLPKLKKVDDLDMVDERFHMAKYKDRLFLALSLPNNRVILKNVLVLESLIVPGEEVEMITDKSDMTKKPELDVSQVHIILSGVRKELTRLESMVSALESYFEDDITSLLENDEVSVWKKCREVLTVG